jgi:hypothetical protein
MTVYGPATGNYSSGSIGLAKKKGNASAGDQILNGKFVDNTGGTNNYSGGSGKKKKKKNENSFASDVQKAFEAKNKALQEGLNNELSEIKKSSDDSRSDAYVNSRLSAIGNNEQLANQGLAGNLYGSNLSGISESSRIKQDTALQNNINALDQQQTSLENSARTTTNNMIADNQLAMAQTIAQLRQQEREMERAELMAEKAEYAQNIGQFGQDYKAEMNRVANDGDPSNDWQLGYLGSAREGKIANQATAQAEAEQQAFENSIKLMNARKSSGGGGSYKGLSASQAQTAYNNGARTPQVMEAMDHWFGITGSEMTLKKPTLTASEAQSKFDKVSEDGGELPSAVKYAMLYYYGESANPSFNELAQKISNMSQDGKRSWIQYYNQNKKIDDQEAMYLLSTYGII